MAQNLKKPQLGFSEAINASTSKIFQFKGRSRRSEYWWTMLLVFLVNIILTPLVGFLFDLATIPLTFRRLHDIGKSGWWYGGCVLMKVGLLISFIYDMAMSIAYAEDLHGYEEEFASSLMLKYGLWVLAIIIYQIVLFVFYCFDSEIYENDYGKSPKYEIEESEENE